MPRVPPRPGIAAGTLTPEAERGVVARLMSLYREGWFPMFEEDTGVLEWVQPRERSIVPIEESEFRVSRSLRAAVRRGTMTLTTDEAFEDVMRACARPAKGREQTWINEDIVSWFVMLHRHGHAHSIEAWIVGPPMRSTEAGWCSVFHQSTENLITGRLIRPTMARTAAERWPRARSSKAPSSAMWPR